MTEEKSFTEGPWEFVAHRTVVLNFVAVKIMTEVRCCADCPFQGADLLDQASKPQPECLHPAQVKQERLSGKKRPLTEDPNVAWDPEEVIPSRCPMLVAVHKRNKARLLAFHLD